MRRREFLSALGGAAAGWPLGARAQHAVLPLMGFLSTRSPSESAALVAAFHRGLGEGGYAEGRNVAIEYRWAEGQPDRLAALAADLVQRQVKVIVAVGGESSALAAKRVTPTIPIVFTSSDPIRSGLVASLNRPGGNATGVSVLLQEMEGKRLGLLHELVPAVALIAVLIDSNDPNREMQTRQLEAAARALNQKIHILEAGNAQDIGTAFTKLAELKAGALMVAGSPIFNDRREQIIALANHYKIPTIYEVREFARAGGLMSYGTNLSEAYRQAGTYAGRILKGEKAGDLPVFQLSKFEFVINLKTARALGIEVPGSISARADEVIE